MCELEKKILIRFKVFSQAVKFNKKEVKYFINIVVLEPDLIAVRLLCNLKTTCLNVSRKHSKFFSAYIDPIYKINYNQKS